MENLLMFLLSHSIREGNEKVKDVKRIWKWEYFIKTDLCIKIKMAGCFQNRKENKKV